MSDPLAIERLTFIPRSARNQLRRRGLTFTTDLAAAIDGAAAQAGDADIDDLHGRCDLRL